jgi:hypothetical protein
MRVLGHARQQLAGARRFDHGNSAVTGCLCQLRIERHQEVQTFTGVGVDDTEECRIGHVQIGLIDRDLRCVDGVEAFQAVAFDRFPALVLDALVFPKRRIDQSGQRRALEENPVGMPAKQLISGLEFQSLWRRELESGIDEMLSRALFEKMSSGENVFHARREYRVAHPVELDLAQTFSADRACTKVQAIIHARRLGAFNQLID